MRRLKHATVESCVAIRSCLASCPNRRRRIDTVEGAVDTVGSTDSGIVDEATGTVGDVMPDVADALERAVECC